MFKFKFMLKCLNLCLNICQINAKINVPFIQHITFLNQCGRRYCVPHIFFSAQYSEQQKTTYLQAFYHDILSFKVASSQNLHGRHWIFCNPLAKRRMGKIRGPRQPHSQKAAINDSLGCEVLLQQLLYLQSNV